MVDLAKDLRVEEGVRVGERVLAFGLVYDGPPLTRQLNEKLWRITVGMRGLRTRLRGQGMLGEPYPLCD
jgi:hypothetical protein